MSGADRLARLPIDAFPSNWKFETLPAPPAVVPKFCVRDMLRSSMYSPEPPWKERLAAGLFSVTDWSGGALDLSLGL